MTERKRKSNTESVQEIATPNAVESNNQSAEVTVQNTEEDSDFFSGLPTLQPAKSRLVLLYLTGRYTKKQIAKLVNVSEVTITKWLMQPEVQYVITELQKREYQIIDSSLKSIRQSAVETMGELLSSPMDGVRFQAAKDVLDRTGHKPVQQVKIDKTVTTIEEQLRNISSATQCDANVIDITDVIELVKNGTS